MKIRIRPQDAVFHEKILDTFGSNFSDHAKGIGEWLKNSVDAYIRENISDENQNIILNFSKKNNKLERIECIDFVGTTFKDIEESLKVWGNPDAASKGREFKVYGGHGNGGKFYMRQMFESSYFITYRDDRITVFGFNKEKKYGYDEKYKDTKVSFKEAIKIAEIPEHIFKKKNKKNNFSIVKGIYPKRIGNKKIVIDSIIKNLITNPQSRQLLNRSIISVFFDYRLKSERLLPGKIQPKPGFEEPITIKIPSKLSFNNDFIIFSEDEKFIGELILRTSNNPFSKKREDNLLNCIEIIGSVGVIASYRMQELTIKNRIGSDFIYGECKCPALEKEELSLVQNDRSKLIEKEHTSAILNWISIEIDKLAERIQAEECDAATETERELTSYLNKILHNWSKSFFNKFLVEIYGGKEEGSGFGGFGEDGFGRKHLGGKARRNEDPQENKSQGGAGDIKIKKPRFPQVLLSGIDVDPISGKPFFLDPRQDIIYQRKEDVENHIWWINTQKPFAVKILNEEGPQSVKWKDYLFQRYVNIIINYVIEEKWKIEHSIEPVVIQQWILETLNNIYESAYKDLESYLFE